MEWIEIVAAITTIVTGVVAIAGAIQATRKKRKLSSVPGLSQSDSRALPSNALYYDHWPGG